MQHSTPQTRQPEQKSLFFDLTYLGVCLVMIGYYLLKFNGTSLLSRAGEHLLDSLFIGIISMKFFRTVHKSHQQNREDGE